MKVSVIIPVYNGQNHIEKTIMSIMNQTVDVFEVLVVNDGSSDDTKKIVERISAKNKLIKLINIDNGGVSNARNIGLLDAQGDYVSFLDADDLYELNYIEEMLKVAKRQAPDVIYSGFSTIDNSKEIARNTQFTEKSVLNKYIANKVNPSICSIVFRKEFLRYNNILFPINVQYSEDVEFLINALVKTKVVKYVPKRLLKYNISNDDTSLSSFSLDKIDLDYISIMRISKAHKLSKKTKKLLIDYRLNAIITNSLHEAVSRTEDPQSIVEYIERYKKNVFSLNKSNGLRSLKINFKKLKILKFYFKNR